MSGRIAASGNIKSIYDSVNFDIITTLVYSFCLRDLFNGCAALTTAPDLPATTLATCCYVGMFYGCTSLVTVPILPATTLVENCYMYMFAECNALQVSETQTSAASYV